MSKQNFAIETYNYFSILEGNQHIASEFALKKIIDIIDLHKVQNVLELGLGIGSVSYCVMEFSKLHNNKLKYFGTESNEFCLNALSINLKEYFNKINIFNDITEVPKKTKFDLIIVDGKDENLIRIKDLITNRGIIIIEGDRIPQLHIIQKIFPKSIYTRVISKYKNPKYGPFSSDNWCGGIQLVFINPTNFQKINYFYYKILTSLRYKMRTLKK